jgi:bacteriorhodopsin
LTARRNATVIGPDVSKAFLITGIWTLALWFLYPIAWGLSEGGNVITPDSEAVFYGILDVLAKPGFGALLLFFHRGIEPARLGLHIREYDDDMAVGGTGHYEKGVGATNGLHHGATTTAPTTGTTATAAV